MAREGRMRWPHFIQNSIESTLKGPFLAEKLQIRSSDTSSVTFQLLPVAAAPRLGSIAHHAFGALGTLGKLTICRR